MALGIDHQPTELGSAPAGKHAGAAGVDTYVIFKLSFTFYAPDSTNIQTVQGGG